MKWKLNLKIRSRLSFFLSFFLSFSLSFFLSFFRATPEAYRSSQAMDRIRAVAAGLCHSGYEACLWLKPHLMAMPVLYSLSGARDQTLRDTSWVCHHWDTKGNPKAEFLMSIFLKTVLMSIFLRVLMSTFFFKRTPNLFYFIFVFCLLSFQSRTCGLWMFPG